jgi:tryptophanyl-tRNA synthetase
MDKTVILTGLRANNDLHIGNYFGALLPLIDMAKKHAGEYQINLFVPDLHSFTTPIDHSKLQEQIMHNLRLFVAAGLPLSNSDVFVYRQSYVPAHSELTVILNSFTGIGEMERMTQFKDKSAKLGTDRVSVGLFDYPVLMAADILLYGATYVPVGVDQSQHLEITRDLAQRLNTKFDQELFTVPKSVKEQHEFFGNDQGLRIKDLVDPTKKMSKSEETEKGIIFLSDDPKAAAKKIMGAATDSLGVIHYDPKNQLGISNLLQILALLQGRTLKEVVAKYEGQTNYGELKKDVASAVEAFLTDFQQNYQQVDMHSLTTKLEASEAKMNEIANQTLAKVQKAVGLR